jgi:hypothetical protein
MREGCLQRLLDSGPRTMPSNVHEMTIGAVIKQLRKEGHQAVSTEHLRPDVIAFIKGRIVAIDVKTKSSDGSPKYTAKKYGEYDEVWVIKAIDLDDVLNGTFTINAKKFDLNHLTPPPS